MTQAFLSHVEMLKQNYHETGGGGVVYLRKSSQGQAGGYRLG